MSERTHAWLTLDHDELAPMVGYVNRVVQVAGKYTLDAPFEVGWGNTVLDVTPRGLRTPTFRQPGVAFTVHYRLLDGDVVIEADTGSRTVSLAKGSVASFFEEFCDAAAELGVDRPRTTLVCEIPDCAPTFQSDRAERTWDPRAARLMWEAWNIAAGGLEAWQAPFRGNHPRVGVMWGGFDLSATRHSTRPTEPPARPAGLPAERPALGVRGGGLRLQGRLGTAGRDVRLYLAGAGRARRPVLGCGGRGLALRRRSGAPAVGVTSRAPAWRIHRRVVGRHELSDPGVAGPNSSSR
ncbi:DUF5996 family protein [Streptomyces cyaneofuscatus]|uniref:DUF5996 family protein n=1 Tax=Streptomyces cyaneofuscatus TaxID=66883 RepID=UPI003F4BD572